MLSPPDFDGSISSAIDITIPKNFIISNCTLNNSKGIETNTTVIFDPAALSNFIHHSLINELGWSIFSEDYSIFRMDRIERSNKISK